MNPSAYGPSGGLSTTPPADQDLCFRPSRWQRLCWKAFQANASDRDDVRCAAKPGIASFPMFQRELFSRLYAENVREVPAEERGADAAWAAKAHAAAEQLPEWQNLRDRVRGDELWSGMAALALSEAVGAALPAPPPPEAQESVQRLRRQVEGLEGIPGAAGALADAQRKLAKAEAAMTAWAEATDESKLRQALRRGVEAANKEVSQAEEAASAFGYGTAEAASKRSGTVAERTDLLRRIRNNKKLARIAAEAGRLRRIAAQKQKDKVKQIPSEVTDVEQGADLARVLPAELARLRNPLTRTLFLRDFAERKLVQYRLDGKEVEGRGPIIVAIDNSGSMSGEREVWSKAVALAMLEVAARQKRAFTIIHWNTSVVQEASFPAGGVDSAKLLDAMDFFAGGGTDLLAPAARALQILGAAAVDKKHPLRKADVVFVTDGDAGTHGAKEFRVSTKHFGATVYGVLVGGRRSDRVALSEWCDQVVAIDDVGQDAAVHNAVFSI